MTDRVKIKYWWSSDKKWFCILTDDGVSQTTVSLTPEEAALLSMSAVAETKANALGNTSLVSGVSSAPNHQPHAVSQGWRDIETAPKGERILLGGFYASGNFDVDVGAWVFTHRRWPYIGDKFPTHWMPLPAPPLPENTPRDSSESTTGGAK